MISHEHKLIFIHIPKCAGVSVATYLNLKGPHHQTLQLHVNREPRKTVEEYFKFTLVRNPWSKAVSWFLYCSEEIYQPKTVEAFRKWITSGLPTHWTNVDGTFWKEKDPLSNFDFLDTEQGINLDYWGKVESIVKDMGQICDQIGVSYLKFPHENQGKQIYEKIDYVDFYDKSTKDIISERYGKDIDYFKYSFAEK